MGNIVSESHNADFATSLHYMESACDRNMGMVDVYRASEAPYDYIMDYKKNFVEDNDRMRRYLRLISQLKGMQHKNIAKIYHFQLVQENQMCIKHKRVHLYCSYFNFTLDEAVKKKKILDSQFSESELLYVMGSLVEISLFLKKYGLIVGEYRPQSIYLSPEGYIKVYLLEADEQNKHSCYYKILGDKQQLDSYIIAPEQLVSLGKMEYETKYDPYRAELFTIAMVILQLITFDKPKFYYNDLKTELKLGRIQFDISTCSRRFSQKFVNFLKVCLRADPHRRFSLQQAAEELTSLRKSQKSTVYCLRLGEDDDKDQGKQKNIQKEKENQRTSSKGKFILRGIERRLTPSPITTLSNSTSSSMKFQTKPVSNRTTTWNLISQ